MEKEGGGSNKLLVFMISTVLMESAESTCKCYIDLKHYSDNRLENINFQGNACLWFFRAELPQWKTFEYWLNEVFILFDENILKRLMEVYSMISLCDGYYLQIGRAGNEENCWAKKERENGRKTCQVL